MLGCCRNCSFPLAVREIRLAKEEAVSAAAELAEEALFWEVFKGELGVLSLGTTCGSTCCCGRRIGLKRQLLLLLLLLWWFVDLLLS